MLVDKARMGVIGTGWWATTAHLPVLKAHPEAELVALADIRPEVLAKAAEKYEVDKIYTDYREMLANEALEGVVVAVWHADHYEVAGTCLEHNLHLMLEKPMVLLAPHARALIELARARNREIIIGYPWHYTSHTRRAREVLQSGALGPVRFIYGMFASTVTAFYRGEDPSYQPVFNCPVIGPGDVYSDPQRSGGGQGHLQVTHSAALVLFMTSLKPRTVLALMNNMDAPVDVVDALIVQMDNGALGTFGSTGTVPAGDPERMTIQIYCDHGWMDMDITGTISTIIGHPDGFHEILSPLQGVDAYQSGSEVYPAHMPVTNLIEIIKGRGSNGSPPEIGRRTAELFDAAYRFAAREGQAVNVASLYR